MSIDLHSGRPGPASSISRLLGWLKARFRDVMIVAEVQHDVQWSAPWRELQPPFSQGGDPVKRISTRW